MNDILKYWPMRLVYDGKRMMIPMGEITNIAATDDGKAHIEVRGDTWTTDSNFDEVMEQWTKAIYSVQTGWEHIK